MSSVVRTPERKRPAKTELPDQLRRASLPRIPAAVFTDVESSPQPAP
jgi:hypothetical protein